ncbi:hypothetical protein EVAR_10916_1 [Eumeta japonica]|uniref:Mos1 transposase HTH domain-containing protein n=1 Tax=Eumeta variegata TaxID=151549 RepID=A0A4C1U604_EUMVA|nr:hypothetical protein EVAR_10916_1 [Eumeta japonica]
MSIPNVEIDIYNLKFYYNRKSGTQNEKKICDAYGPNTVSVRVAQNWFKRFQSSNFDAKDELRSTRPVTDKVDGILEKVEHDRSKLAGGGRRLPTALAPALLQFDKRQLVDAGRDGDARDVTQTCQRVYRSATRRLRLERLDDWDDASAKSRRVPT